MLLAVAPGPRVALLPLLLLRAYQKQVGSGFDGRLKTDAAGGWHGWISEVCQLKFDQLLNFSQHLRSIFTEKMNNMLQDGDGSRNYYCQR